MKITSIQLENFRNHEYFKIFPKDGINFLLGGNGRGKTAVLEGCSLALQGVSWRKNWIKKDQNTSSVYLNFEIQQGRGAIQAHFFDQKPSYFLFNQKKMKRKFPLKGFLVLFIPEHLSAIRGDASQRRKLVDDLAQSYPQGRLILRNFQKILDQKNRFLKLCKKGFYSPRDQKDCLLSINEKFQQTALDLIHLRLLVLENFQPFWEKRAVHFLQTSDFFVQYLAVGGRVIKNRKQAEVCLKREMEERGFLEALQGVCLAGPQRHDLNFVVQGCEARKTLSQGQQRALLLSWKMAEWDQIYQKTGEQPLFFLDDVFSEIDQQFRKNLIQFLLSNQVQSFVTAAEIERSLIPQKGAVFHLGDRFERDSRITAITNDL